MNKKKNQNKRKSMLLLAMEAKFKKLREDALVNAVYSNEYLTEPWERKLYYANLKNALQWAENL